jgi:hypothetical protein
MVKALASNGPVGFSVDEPGGFFACLALYAFH